VLINAVAGEVELYDMGIVTAHPPMEGQEVDWKRLVQFALLGSSDLEQYAIPLVRVPLGLFFAISGANKLFVAGSLADQCSGRRRILKKCTKPSLHRVAVTNVLAVLFGVSISCDMPIRNAMPRA
jgi:hypothetical protein